MVKVKKKEKGINFKTVTGENIKLVLGSNERIIKITILNSTYISVHRRIIILLIIAILNLLSLILHILNVQLIIAVFIFTLLELYRISTTIKEECLVVVKCLGFQLTTKYIIGIKTLFIPWEQVQNIFINEIIFKHKIIYVLNLLTKDADSKEKLIPLFFETLPRMDCLKAIYKDLKAIRE